MYARFENDPLKTVEEADYTNSISSISCKKLLKITKFKNRNSVEIHFMSFKKPHAHSHYIHKMYASFEKDPLKTMGEVDYTNSTP